MNIGKLGVLARCYLKNGVNANYRIKKERRFGALEESLFRFRRERRIVGVEAQDNFSFVAYRQLLGDRNG